MQLHNLKPAAGSVKSRKRVARGEGSGGSTAGKGNKGQQSRTGYQSKNGFEGGQMPLQRRMPKRGFKNIFREEYRVFNLGQVDALVEKYQLEEFSTEQLYINGLIKRNDKVKILGTGELTSKISFNVEAMSGKAKEAIEALGGAVKQVVKDEKPVIMAEEKPTEPTASNTETEQGDSKEPSAGDTDSEQPSSDN